MPTSPAQPQCDELRDEIRQAVRAVEPDAEVILYGSRARGDAHADSDWDLLILVEGPVDPEREKSIRHRLYAVEWDTDEVLTSVICSRKDWNSPLYRAMPFHQNVDRDGIAL
ncbi:MAG TPA: nucleotidyltransferase domain-containing protein [Thermoanaerobaculia bacterium]|jgi:predicted nucleotidyltransferase